MPHAKLSPSGASRWMACPASVRLEESYPDTTSVYAEEGTRAHALAEKALTRYLKHGKRGDTPKHAREHPAEMLEAVDEYVQYVLDLYPEGGKLYLEERLDLSRWIPEGFGTADAIIAADGVLHVVDLKYGKGVKVDASHNPQLMCYALGAEQFLTEQGVSNFEEVRLHIVQPRLHHFDSWTISRGELLDWGLFTLSSAAETAFEGRGDTVPGAHCRFCKARLDCKAVAVHMRKLTGVDFLSCEERVELLRMAPEAEKYFKDIQAKALEDALAGILYPGFKLVEGRRTRSFLDVDEVLRRLRQEGYEEETLHKPREPLTLTGFEKLLGKKQFKDTLGDLVCMKEGKPTLVPEEDKRPALQQEAVEFFSDDIL